MIRSILIFVALGLLVASCERTPTPKVATPSPTPTPERMFSSVPALSTADLVFIGFVTPTPTPTPATVWLGQKLAAETTPRVVELGIRDDGFVVWRDTVTPTPPPAPSVEIEAIGTPAPTLTPGP